MYFMRQYGRALREEEQMLDPVDPDLDARSFGKDAVFVPAKGIDSLQQRGFIG